MRYILSLKGSRTGQHSIRINDQWRVCFLWLDGDAIDVEIVDYHWGKVLAENNMRLIHPGEILREEYLVPLGMSANALAIALRVPAPRINDIVLERRAVTPDTALRLAQYFGGDAEGWMNLQVAYDLRRAEQASGEKIRDEIIPRAAWSNVPEETYYVK